VVLAGWIAIVTEYQTAIAFNPVRRIAAASASGPAANVIAGLAGSLRAAGLPILVLGSAMAGVYYFGGGFSGSPGAGLFAISVSVVAMLSLAGTMIGLSAFAPVAENADAIAEMASLPDGVRDVTRSLGAAGKTAQWVARGYALGSAVLAALVLFAGYVRSFSTPLALDLASPSVLVGLLIGMWLPYLVSALLLDSLIRTARRAADEAERQSRESYTDDQSGLGRLAGILAMAAIRGAIVPIAIPLAVPVAIGFLAGKEALAGLLFGCIIAGLFQSVAMTSSGGAWASAKQCIEDGMFGGRRSDAYEAATTGKTVGAAYGDTAGAAINPLIKVVGLTALMIVPLIG